MKALRLLLLTVTIAAPALCQAKVMGTVQSFGNSWAGVDAITGISCAGWPTRVDDNCNGQHQAHILKHDVTLATMDFPATSFGGGNAHPLVKARTTTVFTASYGAAGGQMTIQPTYTEFNGWNSETISVGPFDVQAHAGVGVGSQGWGTWAFGQQPRRANAETHFAQNCVATGRVTVSLLFGAASASVTADVNLLNRAAHLSTGNTALAGLPQAHANVVFDTWQLLLKLKVQLLWGLIDYKRTLVNESGGHTEITGF